MPPTPKYDRRFADLLNKYLGKEDRSASWLAARLGMSRSAVNRWLNGERLPEDMATVAAICTALHIDDADERQAFFDAAGLVYHAAPAGGGLSRAAPSAPPPATGAILPIDITDILQSYLDRELRQCSKLPLAKPKLGEQRVPRLERVFVELRTTLPVDEATWFDRLGVADGQRDKVRTQLQRHAPAEDAALRRLASGRQPDAERAWWAELHRLDDEKFAPVAQILGATRDQVRAARHPLTPLEHLHNLRRRQERPHLVILGDPGGGKSTWMRRLTSVLSRQWLTTAGKLGDRLEPLLTAEAAWLQAAQAAFGAPAAGLIPLRIPLHRWASWVRKGELKLTGAAADLVAACAHALKQTHAGESIPVLDHTLALLKRGDAVILLDGLDEVVDEALRTGLIAAVRSFTDAALYRQTPVVVTCRSKPYARLMQQKQAVLSGRHVCTLGPLDEDAILQFIERWYAEMTWAELGEPGKLQVDARRLQTALPVREDLRRMAQTPLLLTMMARTNQESGLPDGRAELYENLVQELLWEWETVHRTYDEKDNAAAPAAVNEGAGGEDRALADILRAARPDLSRSHLEQALSQLAYAVHTGGDEPVEIERATLEFWLGKVLPHKADDPTATAAAAGLATTIVNFIGRRTGLLVEVDVEDGEESQRFTFTHRTFQEYLAARWMATGGLGVRQKKIQEKLDDVNWREAIFLALGCLVSSVNEAYDDALVIVERFLRTPPQHERELARHLLVSEAFVRQFTPVKLALATDPGAGSAVVALVAERLREVMQKRTLAPAQRLEAGLLLDDLGVLPEGLDDFLPVPGADFRIGKYPVTNAQFRRFVRAGGYGENGGRRPAWWSEAGWKQRQQRDWTEPRYWDDRQFNRDTQPVVGVSWYEAEAYCKWLNLTAEGQGYKPAEMTAKLPTREEWMLAARNGQTTAPSDEVDYPWNRAFDATRANTKESNLEQTAPVDMYMDGATPAGVFDMAGNVWEWTADAHEKYRDAFWLKGGSWREDAEWARASAADFGAVGYWNVDLGFRLVCVPVSHG